MKKTIATACITTALLSGSAHADILKGEAPACVTPDDYAKLVYAITSREDQMLDYLTKQRLCGILPPGTKYEVVETTPDLIIKIRVGGESESSYLFTSSEFVSVN
ncbi:hypothetical protein J7399_07105 [Shimia sp. R9_1]|uniref:hypothetical protein n=1 Tax=Shimia sp. R9_1 TaxID=2821111 RepID=UPI001ADB42FA|nr:hypothetical protein [Shimia sp. R9_1]MBO9407187.1 hypothetical protein [Shimia sp. R9_1]